ncbi:MAG: hypothetical protein JSW50_01645 [Candidatus Latescibacterota bacterium]|nr:MAG: hypothetical protein JSW50_01645 [Candidatus Latescibacterota bacterium]
MIARKPRITSHGERGKPVCDRSILWVILAIAVLGLTMGCGAKQKEFKKPIDVDFDMADIPEPKEHGPSQYYDFIDRTFFKETGRLLNLNQRIGPPKQSINVDAFEQVPNSSWFTNRNGRQRMSLEEIRRGPNRNDGPADGTWTVVRGKTQGVTPGFTIEDPRGDRYIIKFDPKENPEMSTAAEIISSKLFYAMGYNTTENTLVSFTHDQLIVDRDAKIVDPLGNKRLMTEDDLTLLLNRVARQDDGTYRAVASKFLDGVPKGPYSYYGTRKDDPNDIIRHEHRRDLRGLRIMAAWLEHNDVRRINSLDMYVTEDSRSFMRHYLIDFGATLGSASLFPNLPSEGHEYQFDTYETLKSLFTFGIYKRRWLDAQEVEYPSVGYYESELFNPANWKPNYPIPAFQRMTNLDAFWAAKIVMSFTDEQIRAAVEMGGLTNEAAENYLVKTIAERRDKIGRYWYAQVNPLDRFVLVESMDGQRLQFDDLELDAGFAARNATTYRYQLVYHGCDGEDDVIEEQVLAPDDVANGLPLDPDFAEDAVSRRGEEGCARRFYVALQVKRDPELGEWGKWVRVYMDVIGNDNDALFDLIGIERQE